MFMILAVTMLFSRWVNGVWEVNNSMGESATRGVNTRVGTESK